jgi:hypothetical protein
MWRWDGDQHRIAGQAKGCHCTHGEVVVHRIRAPFSAAKRLGSGSLMSCTAVHEQPRHAVWNIAECLDRWRGDVQEATSGGPRGSAPGGTGH